MINILNGKKKHLSEDYTTNNWAQNKLPGLFKLIFIIKKDPDSNPNVNQKEVEGSWRNVNKFRFIMWWIRERERDAFISGGEEDSCLSSIN